ncbi:MAG: hypothetical protein M1831_000902 [Alyxoria varia]|nr:MAG: hypothetical protein M1831_000902 [Alyxoria varia]
MIPLSRPYIDNRHFENIREVLSAASLAGQGPCSERCEQWLQKSMANGKAFLTKSCTSALEMAALILQIEPGDEIILPSYTFTSTANAFALRGAVPVFVGVNPKTMNIDESQIEPAITGRTKAIVIVHYSGTSCDMDLILGIARRRHLLVVEDAAQGICASYKGAQLGTMGDVGCLSFHEIKNVTSAGQGGACLVNKESLVARAETIHDNGTNKAQMKRGEVDHYGWQEVGSNFIMSEVLAAILWAQLQAKDKIMKRRLALWDAYRAQLTMLEERGVIALPWIPEYNAHNAHLFWFRLCDPDDVERFIEHMRTHGISSTAHYSPLHLSPAGRRLGRFVGDDSVTNLASSQLVRVPIYPDLSNDEQEDVIHTVKAFWGVAGGDSDHDGKIGANEVVNGDLREST